MGFDFDRFLGEDPPRPAGKKLFKSVLHSEQTVPASSGGPLPAGRDEIRREEVVKQLVYGDDIGSNLPPENTLKGLHDLYVAFEDPQGRRFGLNSKLLSKHLLLLGGIGTGKTNVFNFILEALLAKQSSKDIIFIFDTKGDFYRTFYRADDPRHIVIGNGTLYSSQTHYWNVFRELEDEHGRFTADGEFTAKEIGKQLMFGRGSDIQPFFSIAASDLIAKVLIDFERRDPGNHQRLNNQELAAWLRSADLGKYIEMIRRNADFANAFLYFGDPGQSASQKLSPQALAVFGYINAMCNDLFTGSIFAEADPAQEFSMRALLRKRERAVVFIEYDLRVGEVLGPMYRLLIDLALKEALSQDGNHQGSVCFIIDEFKLLPDLIHMDDALNFGRSLGVKVFAGVQSIDQIFANYEEGRGRAMLSGFMNSFCFETPDYNSRQYISQRFGRNCMHLSYRSLGEPQSFQREGFVIEDWDIRSLGIGQAAIDLAGQKPFLFQFSDFRDPHRIL